jgi:hypothetical protein
MNAPEKQVTSTPFGTLECAQFADGTWGPWSNWQNPIAPFFRDDWRVRFILISDSEVEDIGPRGNFSLVFENREGAEPDPTQIETALWVRNSTLLLERLCQPVLESMIAGYMSHLFNDWIDPELVPSMERQLQDRGFGTPGSVFRMTTPSSLTLFSPLPDGRVIYSIQFDWSCDETHYPVLYFDKERLITHNHLSEDEWKDALAAEGLPGYRS